MAKPMMFSKAPAQAETTTPRLERHWFKENDRLTCYWFVAGAPIVTEATVAMLAA